MLLKLYIKLFNGWIVTFEVTIPYIKVRNTLFSTFGHLHVSVYLFLL